MKKTEHTIFGMPVYETDILPDGSITLIDQSAFMQPATNALMRGVMESRVRYGKYPPKITLTKEQYDMLSEEFRRNTPASLIHKIPKDAPKVSTFMGIPIEIMQDKESEK